MSKSPANSRRDLLAKSGIALAALALVPVAVLWSARARGGTATKEDFHYQPVPREGKRCADCAAFTPGPSGREGSCKIVAGSVSADGWCMAFSKR